jgi:hypothetical protein
MIAVGGPDCLRTAGGPAGAFEESRMELVLNPRVRIRRDGETFWVQTPDPQRGLQTHVVSRQVDRALFDTLVSILSPVATDHASGGDPASAPRAASAASADDVDGTDDDAVELDDATLHRLGELGVVLPAPAAAPDLTFACELPLDPARASQAAPWARVAHPSLAVQRGPALPPEVAALLGGAALPLTQRFPIAWVTDPVSGVPAPYSITGRHAAALDTLRAGRPAPGDLPDDVRADLAAAEILVAPDFTERRVAAWEAQLRAAHDSFATRGWAVVRGLVPAAQRPALRAYVRAYVAAGYARRGDAQVPLRWSGHNQHLVTLIHGGLNRMITRVAGCPTKPSYSYFAAYMPGAVLARHRDRPQCKYSISLQLDAQHAPIAPWLALGDPLGGADATAPSATPPDREPWPLYLEDLRGELATGLLAPGDGLFYRGCDLTHWRDELPAGRTSTSAFLHYVDLDFAGRLT